MKRERLTSKHREYNRRAQQRSRAARRAAARQGVGDMTPDIVYDVPMSDGVPTATLDDATTQPYGEGDESGWLVKPGIDMDMLEADPLGHALIVEHAPGGWVLACRRCRLRLGLVRKYQTMEHAGEALAFASRITSPKPACLDQCLEAACLEAARHVLAVSRHITKAEWHRGMARYVCSCGWKSEWYSMNTTLAAEAAAHHVFVEFVAEVFVEFVAEQAAGSAVTTKR